MKGAGGAGGGRRSFSRINIPIHRKLYKFLKELPNRTKRILVGIILVLLLWKVISLSDFTSSSVGLKKSKSTTTNSIKTTKKETTKIDISLLPKPIPTPSSKFINYAPTQIKKSSAKLNYSNGKIQEIFISNSRNKLWESVELESIDLSLGCTLDLNYKSQDRESRSITKGKGDDCSKNICIGIESVSLRQDVLVGLNQMLEAGKFHSFICQD